MGAAVSIPVNISATYLLDAEYLWTFMANRVRSMPIDIAGGKISMQATQNFICKNVAVVNTNAN